METSRSRPFVVGITGPIAGGKSTVGSVLADFGVAVIDTDEIAHGVLNQVCPAYQAVLDRFGQDLVDAPGGQINRQKLAAIVFADPQAMADLNAIMHPEINKRTQAEIERYKDHDIVAVQVPLLFECHLESQYDEIWALVLDPNVQLERLKARNNYTDEQAKARIAAQLPQLEKAKRSHRIIDNSGTREATRQQVESCLKHLRHLLAWQKSSAEAPEAGGDKQTIESMVSNATSGTLSKVGDLSSSEHKHGRGCLTSNVHSCHIDKNGCKTPESNTAISVQVDVCVNNGKPGMANCCSSNCRSICRHQSPSEPPNTPPDRANKCSNGCRFPCIPAWLLGILGCLALLTAVILLCCAPAKDRAKPPTAVPCQRSCDKSSQPTPVPPPDSVPSPSGPISQSPEPPSFCLPYLHNNVRLRAVSYSVQCFPGNQGSRIACLNKDGLLINRQEYGPNQAFRQQWIIHYAPTGQTVSVDFFQAPNLFIGRTVYEYNELGKLTKATSYDWQLRPIVAVDFVRDISGVLQQIVVERKNQFGLAVKVEHLNPSELSKLKTDLYLLEQF